VLLMVAASTDALPDSAALNPYTVDVNPPSLGEYAGSFRERRLIFDSEGASVSIRRYLDRYLGTEQPSDCIAITGMQSIRLPRCSTHRRTKLPIPQT